MYSILSFVFHVYKEQTGLDINRAVQLHKKLDDLSKIGIVLSVKRKQRRSNCETDLRFIFRIGLNSVFS